MGEFYAYKYSTSHWFFPKIIITILIILGLAIIILKIVHRIKSKKPLIGNGKKFFVENYDKVKLFGSVLLLVLYILALEWIGFLAASLIFIFLFNVLFSGIKWKSLIISATISVASVMFIWLIFGVLFHITLP
ncbi:MAG: tripartite tricarboxylate transporter TctB family protein [Syntrophaceae bacterium]|nr:tripartite tricarboxylate transporter TctB family protein [Syntrophaceae bacterium]